MKEGKEKHNYRSPSDFSRTSSTSPSPPPPSQSLLLSLSPSPTITALITNLQKKASRLDIEFNYNGCFSKRAARMQAWRHRLWERKQWGWGEWAMAKLERQGGKSKNKFNFLILLVGARRLNANWVSQQYWSCLPSHPATFLNNAFDISWLMDMTSDNQH